MKPLSIGLLGLAGNYKKINLNDIVSNLEYILEAYELIDISTDYGIEHNLLDIICALDLSRSSSKFIFKIGCNIEQSYNPQKLAEETFSNIYKLGESKIDSLIFHRPNFFKIDSDIQFAKAFTDVFPNIPFGISSNSSSIYSLYKSNIPIHEVQIALNPLDYSNNINLLKLLNKDKINIQIRSVLASGLLSGKYNNKTFFNDSMRSKFHKEENIARFKKRINTSTEIINYLNIKYDILPEMVPIYLYSLFETMKNIKCVIRGGSSLSQIKNNTNRIEIKNFYRDAVFKKIINDWSCDYV